MHMLSARAVPSLRRTEVVHATIRLGLLQRFGSARRIAVRDMLMLIVDTTHYAATVLRITSWSDIVVLDTLPWLAPACLIMP